MKDTQSRDKKSLMQKATLLFFDRGRTTIGIWLSVLTFGVVSYAVLLQRQGFPDVSVPFGVVSAQYFVNDPTKVDMDVVVPIGEAVSSIDSVKSVQSVARDNFATFFIEYSDEVTSETGNKAVEQVVSGLSLPPATNIEYRAVNAAKFNDKYDVLVSLTSSSQLTGEQLDAQAKEFANRLQQKNSPRITSVEVISSFTDATDPATGQSISVQTGFDRFMVKGANGITSSKSAIVGIVGTADVDALALSAELQDLLLDRSLYSNNALQASISADFAEGIKAQVDTLQTSLFEGFIIILLVGFVLISLRAGLVTALAMMTTLLVTIGGLYIGGFSLNTITLFGLILCLGLIVDDAIIMTEALDAARKSKASKRETAALVTKRVGLASLSGTLTTMLGFAPLLFISGILGEFIRALPITIIMSLAISLIVSLTLVPFLSKYLILGKKTDETRNPVHNLEKRVSRFLSRTIRRTSTGTRQRVALMSLALGLSISSLVVSGMFFGKLKLDIFPSTKDSDGISITATYSQGTDIEEAQVLAAKTDEVVGRVLGENLRKATYSATGNERGSNLLIDLVSYREREQKASEFIGQLQGELAKIDGVQYRVTQLDAGPPRDDFPFKLQIYGAGEGQRRLAADIEASLKDANIERTNGTTAKVIRTQVSRSDTITRLDTKQYVEVSAGFDASDTTAVTTATKEYVQNKFDTSTIETYGLNASDVTYDFGNESDNQDSFRGVLIAFPLLLIVMYVLLLVQFRSFTQPMLILAAIPFSLLGVALGLHYTNNPLSFFVMVALFALIGIAVNNTILLTDYANQARREGKSLTDSMALAIEQRFRPLITTSLTSVIALIPLALSDPFWESLAVTLIFGLLSSTLLVVLVYPYYYLLNEWILRLAKQLIKSVVKTKRA
jgi:multidrug efflux pump subunit AcrB